jgi:6-phosphofructokinase 2
VLQVPDIVAITMNPALDISTSTEAVVQTHKLRCATARYDPGGGAINVAREARTLGVDALAVFPAGGPTGRTLQELLNRGGIPHRLVPIAGQTRVSFTADERRSGGQYRFVFPGPEMSDAEQQTCLAVLAEAARGARFVVATGSLPPGVRPDFFQQVADVTQGLGARLLLDTSGDALRSMRGGVYLLKPSGRELREYAGRDLRRTDEQVEAARELIGTGVAEVVVVSLGSKGALLVTADEHEALPALDVPVRSAVGAGDSMVAAIAVGLVRGFALRRAVWLGMAAGAATLMTPGTEPCDRDDVERLFAGAQTSGA